MTINTNIASLQGQLTLKQTESREATAIQRLSTGLRINSAADDPAGLIAATHLKSDIAQIDGQQTGDERLYHKAALADGVLGVVSEVLLLAKRITTQNGNVAGLTQKQQDANQIALDAIVNGVQRVGITTSLNGQAIFGKQLVSDASDAGVTVGSLDPSQIGLVHDDATHKIYSLADLRTGGALADNANPELADKVVAAAIKQIAGDRASVGSFMGTLTAMGNVRGITRDNLTDALSQIEDTDFAAETSELVRDQTLSQVNVAALAIANSQPNAMLPLLGN